MKKALKGVTHFFSETGTEGGYWAFQDEKYMGIFDEDTIHQTKCLKCGFYGDDRQEDPDPAGSKWLRDMLKTPEGEMLLCQRGEHEWVKALPKGRWSYEGLHTLHDGDELTIYDVADPQKVVWKGVINLKQKELFTEGAFGFWIHADQVGEDRETWAELFFTEHPAMLTVEVN